MRRAGVLAGAVLLATGMIALQPVGTEEFQPSGAAPPCPTNQYTARYFNNMTVSGAPVFERCEDAVGAHYGDYSPAPGVHSGAFSVEYQGVIDFPIATKYDFNADTGNSAIMISLDGTIVLSRWPDPSWGKYLVSREVSAGLHSVRVVIANRSDDGFENVSISQNGLSAPGADGRYFARNSFWNQPVPPGALVDPRSAAWVRALYADPVVDRMHVNTDEWSVAIYHATPQTPTASIRITNSNKRISVPYVKGFRPTPDADAHLAIIDDRSGCVYEFQSFDPVSMSAVAEASYHVYTGSGGHVSGPGHSGGELSYLGGLITPRDVSAGVIDHALRYALPGTINSPTFAYPGTRSDGTRPGGVPEGTRLQLDPSLDLDEFHLTPFQRKVAVALQTYGGFNADSSGNFNLYAESTTDGTRYGQPLDSLPKVLIKHLRFLAPRMSSTDVQLDTAVDPSCYQQH